MLSKIDRVQHLRGSEVGIEQTAVLIFDYVDSVDYLATIQALAEAKYTDFDKYKSRSWGTLIFAKVVIDGALKHLPESADKEKEVLTHLSAILDGFYTNWKHDTKKNLRDLISTFETLLALENFRFTDKQQAKELIFSLYMTFQLIKIGLDKLDWKRQIPVAAFINIKETKAKISVFLQQVEEKAQKLELLAPHSDSPSGTSIKENDPLKTIRDDLNKRYLKVLNLDPIKVRGARGLYVPMSQNPQALLKVQPEKSKPVGRSLIERLTALEADITKISSGITTVLDFRNLKEEIELKIKAVQKLLQAISDNDHQITGIKSVHDLISSNSASYQVLMANTNGVQKEQLIEKLRQAKSSLDSPDLSSEVINTVNWAATPLTLIYRAAAPQILQDAITDNLLPVTLDRECKVELRALANALLIDLKENLARKEQQISAITNRLFSREEELKLLIINQSSGQLTELLKANDAIKGAVHDCSTLLVSVKDKLSFLNKIKAEGDILNEFIKIHNGIFVRICNFLAQFFALFKSDTAKMIDRASTLKIQVDGLVAEYQHSVDQKMLQIENNPNLDASIKNDLKRQFHLEEKKTSEEQQICMAPNKHNVHLLMNNLSQLFSTTPHRRSKKQATEEHNSEEHAAAPI